MSLLCSIGNEPILFQGFGISNHHFHTPSTPSACEIEKCFHQFLFSQREEELQGVKYKNAALAQNTGTPVCCLPGPRQEVGCEQGQLLSPRGASILPPTPRTAQQVCWTEPRFSYLMYITSNCGCVSSQRDRR